jgi:hypothetical protein
MPHTTHAYLFEAKVGGFAQKLCEQFTAGSLLRSFLLILDQQGNVRSLTFGDRSVAWRKMPRELEESATPHVFYDPLEDGVEFIWLSWHKVERSTIERLIGESFDESDFTACLPRIRARQLEPANGFPTSWSVMF